MEKVIEIQQFLLKFAPKKFAKTHKNIAVTNEYIIILNVVNVNPILFYSDGRFLNSGRSFQWPEIPFYNNMGLY
jgi:hypothetical protein